MKTGRELALWPGFCPTHVRILAENIKKQKDLHPEAKVAAHPECNPQVLAIANQVCSTGGLMKYARNSEVKELIVATEIGILHRLRKENPDKSFYPATELAVCPNMKKNNLYNVLESLETLTCEVKVPTTISAKAKKAIERMIEIT